MANLTTKELSALEDQLGFEKMLCCKYQQAAQTTQESELKQCYTQYAGQHKRNYETLLGFLR
ncbi:MAG TPA: spore coat protein [Candidatus Enterenecus stercoripullorum]|nr:spore coat protein [Candidatus Enterenecus stercoripullorum]